MKPKSKRPRGRPRNNDYEKRATSILSVEVSKREAARRLADDARMDHLARVICEPRYAATHKADAAICGGFNETFREALRRRWKQNKGTDTPQN